MIYQKHAKNTHIDRIIFTRDIRHGSDPTLDRRMEPMIVLRSETEDRQRAACIPLGLGLVGFTQQACNRKLASFDPEPRRLADALECHQAAVSCADETIRIVRGFDGTSGRLELTVEKLVECP